MLLAKEQNWINCLDNTDDGFDSEDYEYLDYPLNADLHELVPGRLIAMRTSPRDLPDGELWKDCPTKKGNFSYRIFSPDYYNDILSQMGVSVVLRLGAPLYDASVLAGQGLAYADLDYQETALPSPAVVEAFIRVASSMPGVIALQSRCGLGRAGALAGFYLMRVHGFTAREAIAWLGIVRPGSVVGVQQHFLLHNEEEHFYSATADSLRMDTGRQRHCAAVATPPLDCKAAGFTATPPLDC